MASSGGIDERRAACTALLTKVYEEMKEHADSSTGGPVVLETTSDARDPTVELLELARNLGILHDDHVLLQSLQRFLLGAFGKLRAAEAAGWDWPNLRLFCETVRFRHGAACIGLFGGEGGSSGSAAEGGAYDDAFDYSLRNNFGCFSNSTIKRGLPAICYTPGAQPVLVINLFAALEQWSGTFFSPVSDKQAYIVYWAIDGMEIKRSQLSTGTVLVGGPADSGSSAVPISAKVAASKEDMLLDDAAARVSARSLFNSFESLVITAGDNTVNMPVGHNLANNFGNAAELLEELHQLFLDPLTRCCVGCLVRAFEEDPMVTMTVAVATCDMYCADCAVGTTVCTTCDEAGHVNTEAAKRSCTACRRQNDVCKCIVFATGCMDSCGKQLAMMTWLANHLIDVLVGNAGEGGEKKEEKKEEGEEKKKSSSNGGSGSSSSTSAAVSAAPRSAIPDLVHTQKNCVNVLNDCFVVTPDGMLVSSRFLLDAYFDANDDRRKIMRTAVNMAGKLPMLLRRNKYHVRFTGYMVSETIISAFLLGRRSLRTAFVLTQIVPEIRRAPGNNVASASKEPMGLFYVERLGRVLVVDRQLRTVRIGKLHKIPLVLHTVLTAASEAMLKAPTAAAIIGVKGAEILVIIDLAAGGVLAGSCAQLFKTGCDEGDNDTEGVATIRGKEHRVRYVTLSLVTVSCPGGGSTLQPFCLCIDPLNSSAVVVGCLSNNRLARVTIVREKGAKTDKKYAGTVEVLNVFGGEDGIQIKGVSAMQGGVFAAVVGSAVYMVSTLDQAPVVKMTGIDGAPVAIGKVPFGVACTAKGIVYVSCTDTEAVYRLEPVGDCVSAMEQLFSVLLIAGGHDRSSKDDAAPTYQQSGTGLDVWLSTPTCVVAAVEAVIVADTGEGRVLLLSDVRPLEPYSKALRDIGLAMAFHTEPGSRRAGYRGEVGHSLLACGEKYAVDFAGAIKILEATALYFFAIEANIFERTGRNADAQRDLGQISRSCRTQLRIVLKVLPHMLQQLSSLGVPDGIIQQLSPKGALTLVVEHLFEIMRRRYIQPTAKQVLEAFSAAVEEKSKLETRAGGYSYGPSRLVRDESYGGAGGRTATTFRPPKRKTVNKGAPLAAEETAALSKQEIHSTPTLTPTSYAKAPSGAHTLSAWATSTLATAANDGRGAIDAAIFTGDDDKRPTTVSRLLLSRGALFAQACPLLGSDEEIWIAQVQVPITEITTFEYRISRINKAVQRRQTGCRLLPGQSIPVRYMVTDGIGKC